MGGAMRTLAVDVGGSGIKAMVLDALGQPLTAKLRVQTPNPATPEAVLAEIATLAAAQGDFDRVSVGFPGVVRRGVTSHAINLGAVWDGFPLAAVLAARLGRPVRVANDADVQGLGAIAGQGVELTVTLGTGFGSSLFVNGQLVPNLELGQLQFPDGSSFEQSLGQAALDGVGRDLWNRRLARAIAHLERLFSYDTLYLGGGNAKLVAIALPTNVRVVSNAAGLLGGIGLWRDGFALP